MSDASTPDPQAMMQAFMAAGAVGPEHERLAPFVGTFDTTVSHWMDPTAEPQTSSGTMTNTLVLGGRYLMQDYVSSMPDPMGGGDTFAGRGFWGYSNLAKAYQALWIDSMGTSMDLDEGRCDASGRRWEMHGSFTEPCSGVRCTRRNVIELTDDDHHAMTMFFTMPGRPEMKTMHIAYVRSKG